MADDRPALTQIEQMAAMQKRLDDLESTMLARVSRSTTGTIEGTILATPKPDTLFLQGQTLNRVDYPVLWQWAVDNGRVVAGLFGAGDGTTTFVLPDFRSRVPVGADGTFPLGSLWGAGTYTLAAANMPVHGHTLSGSVGSAGNHDHATTGAGGLHNGHTAQTNVNNGAGPGADHGHPPNWGNNNGNHSHPMNWDGVHSHADTFAVANAGSSTPTPVNTQPPSIALNWMIWT